MTPPDLNKPDDKPVEVYKPISEDVKLMLQATNEFLATFNKGAMDSANLVLRTLVLINGGAAIAVLTFLSGVAAKDKVDLAHVGPVASTITFFAWGVAAAAAAMAFAYFTNFSTSHVGELKIYKTRAPPPC
jgi:hypothetical protein